MYTSSFDKGTYYREPPAVQAGVPIAASVTCAPAAEKRGTALRLAAIYLGVSAFCAVFGAVYEAFSFGVWSYFMVYAFACPLLLGALPALLVGISRRAPLPRRLSRGLWHMGVTALTVGCVFRGILDIYGTSSPLTAVYFVAAGVLLVVSAASSNVKFP